MRETATCYGRLCRGGPDLLFMSSSSTLYVSHPADGSTMFSPTDHYVASAHTALATPRHPRLPTLFFPLQLSLQLALSTLSPRPHSPPAPLPSPLPSHPPPPLPSDLSSDLCPGLPSSHTPPPPPPPLPPPPPHTAHTRGRSTLAHLSRCTHRTSAQRATPGECGLATKA